MSHCLTCANRDLQFVLHGPRYIPEMACAYDMQAYPKAEFCDKYELKRPFTEPQNAAQATTAP